MLSSYFLIAELIKWRGKTAKCAAKTLLGDTLLKFVRFSGRLGGNGAVLDLIGMTANEERRRGIKMKTIWKEKTLMHDK